MPMCIVFKNDVILPEISIYLLLIFEFRLVEQLVKRQRKKNTIVSMQSDKVGKDAMMIMRIGRHLPFVLCTYGLQLKPVVC